MMEESRAHLEALLDMAAKSLADESQPMAGRVVRAQQGAKRMGELVASKLDRARARLTESLAEIDGKTRLYSPSESIAAEVRSTLRGMDQKTRSLVLARAVKAGDTKTITAALGDDVPAFLTGFDPEEHAMRREEVRANAFPHEVERRKRLTAARDD